MYQGCNDSVIIKTSDHSHQLNRPFHQHFHQLTRAHFIGIFISLPGLISLAFSLVCRPIIIKALKHFHQLTRVYFISIFISLQAYYHKTLHHFHQLTRAHFISIFISLPGLISLAFSLVCRHIIIKTSYHFHQLTRAYFISIFISLQAYYHKNFAPFSLVYQGIFHWHFHQFVGLLS